MYGCCFKSRLLQKLHEKQAVWAEASFHSNVSFQPSALYTLMCLHTLSAGPHLTLGCSRYLLITASARWPLPRPVLSEPLCWCVSEHTRISSPGNPAIASSGGGGGESRKTKKQADVPSKLKIRANLWLHSSQRGQHQGDLRRAHVRRGRQINRMNNSIKAL